MNWKRLFTDHSGAGHMRGMAVIMGGAFVVLLLMGKPLGDAFVYALVLACPLMMIGMMFGGHGAHGGHNSHEQADQTTEVSAATRMTDRNTVRTDER